MHRSILIIVFLLTGLYMSGQSAKQADDLFAAHEYAEARVIYDALLRRQPSHPLYLYRAARCAQETGDDATAEALFLKAGTKYPLRDFFLGEIYYKQWRMAEAIASYEAFLPSINEQHERWAHVQQRIASAQVIARYLKHVARVEVTGVTRIAADALQETYTLNEDNGILRMDSIGACFTTQRGDRQYFSVRTTETHDSITSERIVLVSRQRLLHDWEEPDTLLDIINSGQTNVYPFVLTDGATLYFASDREGGLGGLDIYMTRYNAATGEWLPAENMGMPYNSPADDYLYVADEADGYACFATNRHCAGTDSVEVYRIALGDRTFLRGLPENEIVALARLDSLIAPAANAGQAVTPERQTEVTTAATAQFAGHESTTTDSIFFVLNDAEIYTHLDDFQNDSARSLYERYIRLEQTQKQAVTMLDSLRHQYYDANDATRVSLKARIPILSNEIDERKRTMRETLTQIRALESAQ